MVIMTDQLAVTGAVSHAIYRVARLHKMLAGSLLRAAGLHPGQVLLMMRLWQHGPQRQVDLIRMLSSDAATMTRMVRRLEQAGFVRRTPCPDDRRAVIVEPTAASLALREQVQEIWGRIDDLTTAGFDTADTAAALALLHRLERNLTEATGD
jgi:DNA-binding MarR family transcriptional regulator